MDNMNSQELIRMYRAKEQITLRALGEKVGTAYPLLSKIETGEKRLTATMAKRLCEALGIPRGNMIKALREDHNRRKALEWEGILKEMECD